MKVQSAEQVKNSSKGANRSEEMHYMLKKTLKATGTSIRYVRNLVAKQQHLALSVCELWLGIKYGCTQRGKRDI